MITKFTTMEIGKNYNTDVMITDIVEKTAKNGTYLDLKLSDGEKEISAKYFQMSKDAFNKLKGDIICVKLEVSEYNGAPNYKVCTHKASDGTSKKEDFIISAPIASETMYDFLYKTASELQNKDISTLTIRILEDFKKPLLYWSAAKSMHHNCYGGLLYHMYRMTQSAIALTKVYTDANADTVIAGCILHDIGKLKEYDTDEFGIADYTVDGNLFGHLYIGAELVRHYGKTCKTNKEIVRNLSHIIVSHHNNPEWGAIVRPATIEAYLVSQIDMIDSQIYCYEKATQELECGTRADTRLANGVFVYHHSIPETTA